MKVYQLYNKLMELTNRDPLADSRDIEVELDPFEDYLNGISAGVTELLEEDNRLIIRAERYKS